ncbi:MAG: GNAT family N-acetyltransferase [Myxococcales bacterium]|nr:GNAT family N-acetyltransferase [Myxococcales bacterium]
MRLRAAQRSDLPAILGLLEQLNANGTRIDARYRLRDDSEAPLRSMLQHAWFERFMPFDPCLVAEYDSALIAFVSGEPVVSHAVLDHAPTARIDNLWVDPAHRRRGLARQLVSRFREQAIAAGYPRLTVSTLSRDDDALAFWRSMGFDDLRVSLERSDRG